MQIPGPLRSPIVADAAMVVTWSSGFIGAELSRRAGADPLTLLAWRFLILALLLVGLCRMSGRMSGRSWPTWSSWRRQTLVGVLCQPAYLLLVFEGVAHGVPGGTAALIAALQPLLVATVAGRLLGEPTTRQMWAGMALGLAGVAIVVSGDLAVSGTPLWAYLLPTAGMLCLSSGTVLERRLHTTDNLLDTVMMQSVVTAVVLWGLAIVTGRVAVPTALDFWAAVAWLIVLASLCGYAIYVHVARTQGATVVSTLLYLTPPTTMVWAYLMFGTPLTLVAAAGLAVSGVGVALVLRGRRVRERVSVAALRRT